VEQALEYSRESNGAFDVSVGPLVRLWGIGSATPRIPGEQVLAAALDAVDYASVQTNEAERTIYLPREGMGIDVGGIAKGYAADEAARMLREAGVKSALLDFGGNILVVGTKPDGTPWRIGIQVPDVNAVRGQYLGIAEITDLAVVTSGTYERYFVQDGKRYHHILDTTTGFPVENGLESVTIITSESMRADALSTSVFALGLEDGMDFVESLPGVEAAFVTAEGVVHLSSGMTDYFRLTNEDFVLAE
jgi:thiamine biosynthesis lipoprotein